MNRISTIALFLALAPVLNVSAATCEWSVKDVGVTYSGKMLNVTWEAQTRIPSDRANDRTLQIHSERVGIDSFDEFVVVTKSGKVSSCENRYVFTNDVYTGLEATCENFTVRCSLE